MVKDHIKLSKKEFLVCFNIAEEHLKSANILLMAGLYRDSISRSYYAYFDLVAALLATKGIVTKTHGGALKLYSLTIHWFPSAFGDLGLRQLPESLGIPALIKGLRFKGQGVRGKGKDPIKK